MGRHTKQRERRSLRPAALTSVLAVGMVGAITAAGLLTVHLRERPGSSSDSVAVTAAAPASTAPAAAAPEPTPGSTTEPPALSAVQPIDPTTAPGAQLPPSAPPDVPLGVTGPAPVNAESQRVGALFSGGVGPGNHFCTASVIDSPGRNLVLTAAHCLSGASGVTFVPAYRGGQAPYGSWQVTKVWTADGWQNGGDPDEDFAILTVAPSNGKQIEDAVGGNPIGTDASWTAQARLYGYPAGSETPILCTNATSRQDTYQRRIDCPSFPGGTSGGPFVDTTTGRVIGVIGGYQQGGDTDDTSYSALFDHTVAELLARAS